MLEIDFNKKNLDKCLCSNCPVQQDNSCVKDQVEEMEEIGKDIDIDSGVMMGPDEVPKLYCTTGKTKCGDLESHEECQCPKCDVWMENDLEVRGAPAYFCINGRAVECCKIVSDDDERDSKLRELRRSYYTPI
ncbi:MAG: DUF2769 domain-containing protein [Methanobacterium sp.]|jgi:hypothetical protein